MDEQYDEASQRFFQTQKLSKNKEVKHQAFHNMGNVYMQKKEYQKAVEAYKNALRNNPADDETRYNYALAKELLEKDKPPEEQEQDDKKDQKEDVETISSNFDKDKVFVLYADFDKFEDLEKANISKASKTFVNFEEDTDMLVYTLDLKNYYDNLEIIVSLNNVSFKQTFQSAGVLYAVSREEIAAKLVASYIFEPEVGSIMCSNFIFALYN
mgnify:CR=1 FL=1